MNEPELHSVLPRIGKLPLFAVILTIILLCFWQISFFQHSLKWDAIDITLPWRHYTAECLRNGVLPWWNPFQFQGFAHGSIPETWYPPGILLGLFGGYSLYDLNLEYLFHLLIASAGFYRLAKHLGIQHKAACIGALVFPLTGFFIGNAQHVGWIVAGAWLPHVLVSFDKFSQRYRWQDAIPFCLALFMLLTGGYTAYSIVCLYILVIIFILRLWRNRSKIELRFLHRWIRFGILTTATISLAIVCFWQLWNLIDRGAGLAGTEVTEGSFYFKHLISLLYPFASVHDYPSFWHADQSMISVYITIPFLFVLGHSLKQYGKRPYVSWWSITLIFLLLSLGAELPFRKLLNVLPFFELFRFPSLFRYFFILGLLLIACRSLQELLKQPHLHIQSLVRRMALIISILASLVILTITVMKPSLIYEVIQLRVDSVEAAVMFQSGIYLILYGSLAIISSFKVPWLPVALFLAFLGELFTSTQLSGRVSVFASEELKSLQICINKLPNGFPQPSLSDILISNSDRTLQVNSIYRNTNTLYKRVGWDGYTPFQYSGFIDFEKSALYARSLEQPFLYLSTLQAPNPATDVYYSFPEPDLTRTMAITRFSPQEIQLEANVDAPKLLVLNQNTHPSWRVALNDEEAQIELVDGNLTGVILSEGAHKVKFWFEPGPVWNGLLISGVLFIILLGLWMYQRLGIIPSSVVLTMLLGMLLFTISQSDKAFQIDTASGMGTHLVNAVDQVKANEISSDRFLDDRDLSRFREWIFNAPDTITYWSRELCLTTEEKLAEVLEQYYTVEDTLAQKNYRGLVCIRHSRSVWAVESANYFELIPTYWDKYEESIEIEPNGNHCQNMNGRPFSSTFHYPISELEGLLSYVDFSFSVKPKTDAYGARVVFSVRDGENTEIYRKDHTFGGMKSMNPDGWSNVEYASQIPIDLVGAKQVQVYIWNPERTEFLIDDLEVKLQVDVRTFAK